MLPNRLHYDDSSDLLKLFNKTLHLEIDSKIIDLIYSYSKINLFTVTSVSFNTKLSDERSLTFSWYSNKYLAVSKVNYTPSESDNINDDLGSEGIKCVQILDNNGSIYDTLPQLGGNSCKLEFSYNGQALALVNDKSNLVYIYTVQDRKQIQVDVHLPVSFIRWSSNSLILAIGLENGNIYLWDHAKKTKSVVNNNTDNKEAVTNGTFDNVDDLFIGFYHSPFINVLRGIEQQKLEAIILELSSSNTSLYPTTWDIQCNISQQVCINFGGKSLLILENDKKEWAPVELIFDKKYGEIITFCWFGKFYLCIGFSLGRVIVISTAPNSMGKELQSFKVHSILHDISCQRLASDDEDAWKHLKIAVCGDNGVLVETLGNFTEQKSYHKYIHFGIMEGEPICCSFTDDGSILSIGTTLGRIFNFPVDSIDLIISNSQCDISSLTSITCNILEDEVEQRRRPSSFIRAVNHELELAASEVAQLEADASAAEKQARWVKGGDK